VLSEAEEAYLALRWMDMSLINLES